MALHERDGFLADVVESHAVSPGTDLARRHGRCQRRHCGNAGSSFGKTWCAITSSTIKIGTARKAPIGPHNQVQNTSDRNTVSGLSVRRRPMMLGVMKCPSSVVKP